MTEKNHEHYMKQAIMQSRLGARQGNGKTGCVIVKDGEVVASGHNEEMSTCDPTAHAEIITIRRLAQKLHTKDLSGCTLYSTLQPCGMCSVACLWAGIDTVVYGAKRGDVDELFFKELHLNTIDYIKDSKEKDVTVVGGVLEEECKSIYEEVSSKH